MCDPGLCPDAPEEEHERCDHCPLNNLDAAQITDTGQLLRRALDLRSALSMGIRIGLDEIDADAADGREGRRGAGEDFERQRA